MLAALVPGMSLAQVPAQTIVLRAARMLDVKSGRVIPNAIVDGLASA